VEKLRESLGDLEALASNGDFIERSDSERYVADAFANICAAQQQLGESTDLESQKWEEMNDAMDQARRLLNPDQLRRVSDDEFPTLRRNIAGDAIWKKLAAEVDGLENMCQEQEQSQLAEASAEVARHSTQEPSVMFEWVERLRESLDDLISLRGDLVIRRIAQAHVEGAFANICAAQQQLGQCIGLEDQRRMEIQDAMDRARLLVNPEQLSMASDDKFPTLLRNMAGNAIWEGLAAEVDNLVNMCQEQEREAAAEVAQRAEFPRPVWCIMAIWSFGLTWAFLHWYGTNMLKLPLFVYTWVVCVRCTWILVSSVQNRVTVRGLLYASMGASPHILSDVCTVYGLFYLLCVAPHRLISRWFWAGLWESIVRSYSCGCPMVPAVPVDGSEVIAYHGTASGCADAIVQGGFVPSRGGMLGGGVYISRDMSKVQRYATRCGRGTILRLRVQVGRVATIDQRGHGLQNSWQARGFDTAWVPHGCGMVPSNLEEGCVMDPRRIEVIGRDDVIGLPGIPAGSTVALVLWELCCGTADTMAALLAALLVIAPWRLIHLCPILRLRVTGQHLAAQQGRNQVPLLHPRPHSTWHWEVFWHAVAAILDVPCFFSCTVLAMTCRFANVYRAIQAQGGYFGNGASGYSLLTPQLTVFSEMRDFFCHSCG